LAEIHRRLSRRVLGLGWHMLGSREEAEDACSEVFMRLPRAITTYDGSIPFERWLLSIASHHCIDRLRRRMREQRLFSDQDVEPLAVAISAASPLNELVRREKQDAVRSAIERLPAKFRIPLTLRYYGDLSYDEIAAQLGMKRNHVATLIFRAKQELRQTLMQHREV
ncbi:MAG TPA: sigma-70 family RNA polymerase sigma factor, partial [Terriglobales bacterium]|nr:sigma-70 family RNA polymerase sigma factor [Terriglobales bacterium]